MEQEKLTGSFGEPPHIGLVVERHTPDRETVLFAPSSWTIQ